MITGIQIFGDAWTWWSKALGHYQTGKTPEAGAVLVFWPHVGCMRLGHVAVVSQVLTDRIVQVTHANWSPYEGSRGKVEHDVTVVDVSTKGDWSQVKVRVQPDRRSGHHGLSDLRLHLSGGQGHPGPDEGRRPGPGRQNRSLTTSTIETI